MWESLPQPLQEHIQFLSSDFCASATPVVPSSHSVLCIPPSPQHVTPLAEPRDIRDLPLPRLMYELLSRHSESTAFRWKHGWMWMSENEIRTRYQEMVRQGQTRTVDLGFRYMGMGHVQVLSYDPVAKGVFTNLDGGSNGYDRELNHKARIGCEVQGVKTQPFDDWVRTCVEEEEE